MLEQVRVHLGVDQVVDGNDLDVRGALDERLERLATDPAEAVDADAGGHGADLLGEMRASAGRRTRGWTVRTDVEIGTGPRHGRAGPTPDRASSQSYQRAIRPGGRGATRPAHGKAPAGGGGPSVASGSSEGQPPIRKTLPPHIGARALDGGLAVLHRDLLGVLDFDLLLVLDAIGLGHVGSPPHPRVRRGIPCPASTQRCVVKRCVATTTAASGPSRLRASVDPCRPG